MRPLVSFSPARSFVCAAARLAIVLTLPQIAVAQSAPQVEPDFQPFTLEPITFDVDGTAQEDLVLVAAYEAPAGAPVLVNFGSRSQEAQRTAAGRPAPSIILGRIAPGEEADFGVDALLQDTLDAFIFAYNDVAAREALRSSNPDMFRRLIEGGHIDPPEGQTARALQTELARMNCYRSSIDGLWGGGSRRSVTSYFDTLGNGSSWSDPAPSNALFRSILINGDVTCRVAAAPAPRSTTRTQSRTGASSSSSSRSTSSNTQPTQQAPANNAAEVPRAGVFR
ncbi:hypothetical protein TRM7557_00202 [Tritonibacter multivorans]|uniref:Uncharacterized protein n=1 Tax=Tritonibacter multivorans TaxID=928856 RepID=A0A0N7LYJ7_9RHOB|nr:hypothetical protein [Tritonibacter multivorans]MDA7423018.1 hypothetical protein [Tritonibacter multivorans]CUH75057.1 hypothetical protein TRM7557_00202 [Tritonibacter multivorans]SFD77543.1 hypothetical protein SAMN04488049_12911 [Tritonibacter multivorans]